MQNSPRHFFFATFFLSFLKFHLPFLTSPQHVISNFSRRGGGIQGRGKLSPNTQNFPTHNTTNPSLPHHRIGPRNTPTEFLTHTYTHTHTRGRQEATQLPNFPFTDGKLDDKQRQSYQEIHNKSFESSPSPSENKPVAL